MTRGKVHKRTTTIVSFLFVMVFLTACGKPAKDETVKEYQEETDYQFMNYDWSSRKSKIQKGMDGYYFLKSGFLYKIDEETKKVQPLCKNKDCKHDHCEDMEQMKQCSAYMKDYAKLDKQIQYYDGWLYYLVVDFDKGKDDTVSRWEAIKADGSGKVKVVAKEKGNRISKWLVHRGCLYYMNIENHFLKSADQDQGVDLAAIIPKLKIYQVNLKDKSEEKRKLIYQTEVGFESNESEQTFNLFAYGNNLYFSEYRQKIGNEMNQIEVSDDLITDQVVYRYHIISGEKTKVNIPKGSELNTILKVEDQIIFLLYRLDEAVYIDEAYRTDDTCRTLKKIETDALIDNGVVVSDGKYIYIDNYRSLWELYWDWHKNDNKRTSSKHKIQVYDSNFKKVDSYQYQEDEPIRTLPGDDKYMFLIDGSEWNFQVHMMDKSQIGSLKHGKMKKKKIYEYVGDWGGK